jgi:hypothetical protein
LAGERLTAVTVGRVAAIVGRLPRVPSLSRAHLDRYHAVQMRLFEGLAAVLPARYGTSVQALDELPPMLRSREASLRESLRLVRRRAQMTVRMVGLEDPRSGTGDPVPPSRASGTGTGRGLEYLRQRAADASRAAAVPGFDPLRRSVERWVRTERVEWKAGVATVYHLVPRASVAAYRRHLQDAAAREGVGVVVTGPFPPFAFVDG